MKNNTYRLIGLTGPTGSGKTLVSKAFESAGFAVVDADTIAHKALADKECISELSAAFGDDILFSDGSVNRKALAQKAFSDTDSTKKLNRITHPVILRLSLEAFEGLNKNGYKDIVFDAPTLFESGSDKLCDKIVVVTAPVDVRLERILSRDNITQEQAISRINAQHEDDFYTKRADFVIVNDKDTQKLSHSAEKVIKELLL